MVAVNADETGASIERARMAAGLSREALAEAAGVSQLTLSSIISGARMAKLPEIAAIAWATGQTVARLTDVPMMADRVQSTVHAASESGTGDLRNQLLYFLELNDYLADQGIPSPADGEIVDSPERIRIERRSILDQMVAETEDDGLYEATIDFRPSR